MLKESEQTEGQKLLKQLREEYKRPETPSPNENPSLLETSSGSDSWPAEISQSVN